MKKKLLMIMLNNLVLIIEIYEAYKKRNDKVEIREDENVKEEILNLYI